MGWLSYAFWLTSLSRGLTYVLTFWTYLCADCTKPIPTLFTFLSSLLSGKAAKAQQIKEKREEIKEKSTKRKTALSAAFLFGGAYGIRTRDLHTASVARFQLR